MAASTGGICCFAVRGPLVRRDLPGLCARVCLLLAQARPRIVLCDVAALAPEAVAVEALASLQLAAIRHDTHIVLLGAAPGLRELLRLVGLDDALPDA